MANDLKSQIATALNSLVISTEQHIFNSLKEACPKVLEVIFNDRSWQDDTYNLRDSFGYAIYRNGTNVHNGYLNDSPLASRPARKKYEGRDVIGRDELNAFFDEYEARIKKGFEVVFVAGIYYANILEFKKLLNGFIDGEEEAKKQFFDTLRSNKIPIRR